MKKTASTEGDSDIKSTKYEESKCRSQWPRGLRRRSLAARLLRLRVRIPPGAWMFVCCECCVLSGRGLCDELITCPEKSYRLWCVVCDLETTKIPHEWGGGQGRIGGYRAKRKEKRRSKIATYCTASVQYILCCSWHKFPYNHHYPKKCIWWYNTHGVHKLLHISAQRCHLQGVITTNLYKPTREYILMFFWPCIIV